MKTQAHWIHFQHQGQIPSLSPPPAACGHGEKESICKSLQAALMGTVAAQRKERERDELTCLSFSRELSGGLLNGHTGPISHCVGEVSREEKIG